MRKDIPTLPGDDRVLVTNDRNQFCDWRDYSKQGIQAALLMRKRPKKLYAAGDKFLKRSECETSIVWSFNDNANNSIKAPGFQWQKAALRAESLYLTQLFHDASNTDIVQLRLIIDHDATDLHTHEKDGDTMTCSIKGHGTFWTRGEQKFTAPQGYPFIFDENFEHASPFPKGQHTRLTTILHAAQPSLINWV